MRMFAALVPPEHVVADLEEFLGPRQEAEPGLRWTLPEHWHLTLGFMGSVADRHLDELLERLGRAAARRPVLRLAIAGGGAFPNPYRAKLVWAGLDVEPAVELDRLATGVRAAASKAGTAVDGARFHPHITVARTGRPIEATRWIRVLDAYRGPDWTATEVSLVRSHLGEGPRKRPRYELVETFPLGRRTGRTDGDTGERPGERPGQRIRERPGERASYAPGGSHAP